MKKIVFIFLYPIIKLIIALLEWFAIIWAMIELHNLAAINNYFGNVDMMTDMTQNVVFQYVFNVVFIKKDGIKFGSISQTISANLDLNYKAGKLKKAGIILTWFLIDANDPAFAPNAS